MHKYKVHASDEPHCNECGREREAPNLGHLQRVSWVKFTEHGSIEVFELECSDIDLLNGFNPSTLIRLLRQVEGIQQANLRH